MSHIIKASIVGVTTLALLGLTAAFAAQDLKSTGLEPTPISSDPAASVMPATTVSSGTDMGSNKAMDNASLAVTQAQQATEAAKAATDAAKVATDVAKMATDRAAEATSMAKSAMDSKAGGLSDSMGLDKAPISDPTSPTLPADINSSVKE